MAKNTSSPDSLLSKRFDSAEPTRLKISCTLPSSHMYTSRCPLLSLGTSALAVSKNTRLPSRDIPRLSRNCPVKYACEPVVKPLCEITESWEGV